MKIKILLYILLAYAFNLSAESTPSAIYVAMKGLVQENPAAVVTIQDPRYPHHELRMLSAETSAEQRRVLMKARLAAGAIIVDNVRIRANDVLDEQQVMMAIRHVAAPIQPFMLDYSGEIVVQHEKDILSVIYPIGTRLHVLDQVMTDYQDTPGVSQHYDRYGKQIMLK